jgi:hypothetical protein
LLIVDLVESRFSAVVLVAAAALLGTVTRITADLGPMCRSLREPATTIYFNGLVSSAK